MPQTELDGSLGRMGLDHVDVIYSIAGATAPPVEEVVEHVVGLIESGRARAWGTGMWSGDISTQPWMSATPPGRRTRSPR